MTLYTTFLKIIEFGVLWETQFPRLCTFYIRKIQTFLSKF